MSTRSRRRAAAEASPVAPVLPTPEEAAQLTHVTVNAQLNDGRVMTFVMPRDFGSAEFEGAVQVLMQLRAAIVASKRAEVATAVGRIVAASGHAIVPRSAGAAIADRRRLEVAFDVRGRAVPQGGLVRSPAGGLYHKRRPELLDWRARISDAAGRAMAGSAPALGPVTVYLTFRIARPADHYLPANRRRAERELRLDAPAYVTASPDIDKLTRAALDALTQIVFADDSQVAHLVVTKRYVAGDEGPGVAVRVANLEETR